MLFGLYSCGDEVTNPTPTPEQEVKKYTLKEILADSNWVEITDTLHYKKLIGVTQSRYSSLKDSTLFVISNDNEFQNLKQFYDTDYLNYYPDDFKLDFDFEKHTLLIARTQYYSIKIIDKLFFVNHNKNEYCYFVKIYQPLEGGFRMNYYTGNTLLVPKISKDYKIQLSILDGGYK